MKLNRRDKTPERPTRSPSSSGSARVYSYYSSGSRDGSTRTPSRNAPPKRKLPDWRRVPSLLTAIVIVISLGYMLSIDRQPRMVVLSSQQQATLLQRTEVYEAAAEDILDNSLLSRTKLTINTRSIAKQLKEAHPEIADVAIIVPIASHRLVFELQPVEPVMIVSSEAGSYVVDTNGRAVVATKNVPALSKLDLLQITDESGLALNAGSGVLPTQHVVYILELQRQLAANDITVNSMTLPAIPNELHVRPAGEGYYVKFDMQGDARLQAGAFVVVQKRLADSNANAKEYVDVRVSGRAFYK